jgi:hypothetical protein
LNVASETWDISGVYTERLNTERAFTFGLGGCQVGSRYPGDVHIRTGELSGKGGKNCGDGHSELLNGGGEVPPMRHLTITPLSQVEIEQGQLETTVTKLATLGPAGREANHFFAVTNIRRHLEEIEKLRVYLKEPYER